MATAVWNHIGFHGFAVGSLTFSDDFCVWKSAASGRSGDDTTSTSSQIKAAAWTVFGKTGSLRLSGSSEWRLDGFPVSDFEALRECIAKYCNGVSLKPHSMSSAGTVSRSSGR